MTIPVNTVFLAIQAGVRLYQGLRSAYVNSVRSAAITLPLPRAPGAAGLTEMIDWFTAVARPEHSPEPGSPLAAILATGANTPDALTADERLLLRQAYDVCWAEENGAPDTTGASLPSAAFFALVEVRQWAKGQAGQPVSTFQAIAGTLIDTAVFWFAGKPGAISEKHPEGRALKAFLTGIQSVSFATVPAGEIFPRLMIGVLQAVEAEPRLLAGGQKEEALVRNVSRALAEAATLRLSGGNGPTSEEIEGAAAWVQQLAGIILKAGADTVLADPALFLGVKGGSEAAVTKEIGSALLNLLVPVPGGGVQLQALLSGSGVETLARASLAAVGRHPGVLGIGSRPNGVEKLLAELAADFSQFHADSSIGAAFPAIAALVLQRTAENLDALWGVNDRGDPGKNLLVIASRQVLAALQQATQGRPEALFSNTQIAALIDAVLAEVTANPRWVTTRSDEIGGTPWLAAAIEAALGALAGKSAFSLTGADRLAILQAALTAAGRRLALLRALPAGGGGDIPIAALIDAVFAGLARPGSDDAAWRLARGSGAVALLDIAFDRFAGFPAGDAGLPGQIAVLRKAVDDFAAGSIDLDGFAAQLGNGLRAAG